MLQLLIALLGVIVTIVLVVGIHEFGHFIVARLVGVKVLRFSIGFGKILYRRYDKSGTEYAISAIPLGGYVKMLDEGEGAVPEAELPFAYNRQPFYKKFAIVSAGPLFNLLFAFVIYWLVFMIGFTSIVPMIGSVAPNSIAARAGLAPQQEIIRIDNKETRGWLPVVMSLLLHAGDRGQLHITTKSLATSQVQQHTVELVDWHLNELKPDPLNSLGITPYQPIIPATIGQVLPDSPAKLILQPNDKILAINNIPMKDWLDVIRTIEKNPDTTLTFKIVRQGKIMMLAVPISSVRDISFKKHGFLGASSSFRWPDNLIRQNKYGPLGAMVRAFEDTKEFCRLNLILMGKLFTGKVSLQSLGGPITIFISAGSASVHGLIPFLSFLAFLSISIGLINILPIPGLDGGHLLFQVIELIIRRPVSMHVQILFYRLGFILLLMLIAQALINDILRL